MADNAAFETPAQQGPELRTSDGAPSGPFAAAAPIRALLLHQQAPPSPVSATMAGGDQHTDQDATADEATTTERAATVPPNALNAALEDAGGQASDVGAGAEGPPADADDAHMRVALVAAAKAAGDVSSVLLRSVGGDTAMSEDCAAMLSFSSIPPYLRTTALLDRLTATKARLDVEKHELQAALTEQGRLADAEKARLEGEKAALQAALSTQEQRLLAQADQERAAWQQERAAWQQEEARLRREYEVLVGGVRALVPPP